jgi:hypothetical protein
MIRTIAAAAVTAGILVAAAAAAPASAEARTCDPVQDILDGTRYQGSDLYDIRVTGAATCRSARRLARRATYKAVGTPVTGPIKRFDVGRWRVWDDLRGVADRFVARTERSRVHWTFGELETE